MEASKAETEQESEELARFRQQWLEEVRSKKKAQKPGPDESTHPAPAAPGGDTSTDAQAQVDSDVHKPNVPPSPTRRRASHGAAAPTPAPAPGSGSPPPIARKPHPHSSHPTVRSAASAGAAAQFQPTLARAVDAYRRAVQHEQRSELDDALRLYRTAFRIDPNVDRAYHLAEGELRSGASVPAHGHKKTPSNASVGAGAVDGLVHDLKALDVKAIPVAHVAGGFVTGTLASFVASWPAGLAFDPENELEGVPLQKLPDELLVHTLMLLDHTTLERFATVNRKARVVTLDATIWRPMVKTIYQPPQIADDEDLDTIVAKYMTDYRRVYVQHPRVRYDGVYIAVCHYIHLITYYRYLRFYPDGQVLSLLTNEEQPPAHVIPLLQPSLRAKGFLIGTWYLDGTELHIDDLLDPGAEGGSVSMRYSFQMVLDLRSRPLGRWNRLNLRTYDSVRLGSGEATPLALKNERPFWFSKVRSYAHV